MPQVLEITPVVGSAFFLRTDYLEIVSPLELDPAKNGFGVLGHVNSINFNKEKTDDLLNAAKCFEIEKKSLEYLARAEQCRFLLTQKLLKKDFPKNLINKALDYLESQNYLSDVRFAGAFLRNRGIDHLEGESRLLQELLSRGINRQVASDAVAEYFLSKDQEEICLMAFQKVSRRKKDPEKIIAYLLQSGFSYSMIKRVMSKST